jgi:cell division protein FtsX
MTTPEPTETISLPGSSWGPPFLALGITLAFIGAYLGWVYAAVGGVMALAALRAWYVQAAQEIVELPRSQSPVTDVVPPATK